MVIVVEGSQEVKEEITFETTIKEDVDTYIEKGMSTKDSFFVGTYLQQIQLLRIIPEAMER